MAKDDKKKAAKGGKQQSKKKGKGKGPEKQVEAIQRDKPPRLRTRYEQEIVPKLMKEFGYRSVMQVPRLKKVTLNVGLGRRSRTRSSWTRPWSSSR